MTDQYVQWGFELIKNSYLNKKQHSDSKDELYLHYLSPFSQEFFGSHSPVLLFGGHDFKEVEKNKTVSLRDGLIPLYIFFETFKAKDFSCELMIHKDFWFIVPDDWREKVRFYNVRSKNEYSKSNLPSKIIVTGILNSTFVDPDEFGESLDHLANTLGRENLKNIEVISYFPDKRNDLWGSWEEDNILRYSKMIFEKLKLDIKTPTWRDLTNELEFLDCLYYEVNAGLFIKDSFVQFKTLSKGAGLLQQNSEVGPFKKVGEIPASLYHTYDIYKLDVDKVGKYSAPFSREKIPYFKRIAENDFNGVRINMYWEQWFASYLKKVIKDRKLQK